MAKRTTLEQFRKKALKRPKVKTEYEALAPDFEMKRQMIAMRRAAGLTQEQVAEKLSTKKSNISRWKASARRSRRACQRFRTMPVCLATRSRSSSSLPASSCAGNPARGSSPPESGASACAIQLSLWDLPEFASSG
jgi:hypothetical protein